MNVIDINKILEDKKLPDISKFLIETALDIQTLGKSPSGFCLLAFSAEGIDYSHTSLNQMEIAELELFIGKLSIELQKAIFKANCIHHAQLEDK